MNELNKIYNEDCLEGMKRIEPKSVDLIITDPPYLHVKGGMKSKKYNTGTWKANSDMVTRMSDFDKSKIYEFLDVIIPKMKKVNMYIFCSKLQLLHYFEYLSEHKKLKFDLLVWDKVKYSMKSTKFYTSDIEYIVRIYEPGVSLRKVFVEDGSKSNINLYLKKQSYQQPKGEHGTMKPVDMLMNFINVASDKDQLILDPFIGSGSTAIAAINTNRNFIGFELDETYFNLANERIEKHRTTIELEEK